MLAEVEFRSFHLTPSQVNLLLKSVSSLVLFLQTLQIGKQTHSFFVLNFFLGCWYKVFQCKLPSLCKAPSFSVHSKAGEIAWTCCLQQKSLGVTVTSSLQRKVRCWDNGCSVQFTGAQAGKHFSNEHDFITVSNRDNGSLNNRMLSNI